LVTYLLACLADVTDNEIYTTLAHNSNQRLYLFNFDELRASNATIAYNTYIVINYTMRELFDKGPLATHVSSSNKILNFTIFKSFALASVETNVAIVVVNVATALRFNRSNNKILL